MPSSRCTWDVHAHAAYPRAFPKVGIVFVLKVKTECSGRGLHEVRALWVWAAINTIRHSDIVFKL